MSRIEEQEKREQIKQWLQKKIGNMSCPMCRNSHFIMIDACIENQLDGEGSAPTVALVCKQCAFVSEHSIGMMLKKEETGEKEITQPVQTANKTSPDLQEKENPEK